MRSDVQSAKRWALVGAVLSIGAGLVAIIVPAVAAVTTSILIGWILLAAGVFELIEAFSARNLGHGLIKGLLAVVTFAAGLYLLLAPLDGAFTLTVMLVIWFVAIGFIRIVAGFSAWGVPGAGMTVANGVLSLILGILIGNNLPESADWAIGLLVGIDLIFWGMNLLIARSALDKVEDTLTGGPVPAT